MLADATSFPKMPSVSPSSPSDNRPAHAVRGGRRRPARSVRRLVALAPGVPGPRPGGRRSPGHAGAGSKGTARIFRLGYPDPLYVAMAVAGPCPLERPETDSGRALLAATEPVNFGKDLDEIASAMDRAGTPAQRLAPGQAARRFGQLRIEGPSLVEENAGVLAADECLRALIDTGSFEVRAGAPVVALDDTGDRVTVAVADGHTITADLAIVCAGPGRVPPPCPTARRRRRRGAADPPAGHLSASRVGRARHPPLHRMGRRHRLRASGQRAAPPQAVAPRPRAGSRIQRRPRSPTTPAWSTDSSPPPHGFSPPSARSPSATERCLYDNSLDADFILDRVGRIVVGCGTSGHGFKFGPLLGEIMADLAHGVAPPIRLARFSPRPPLAGAAEQLGCNDAPLCRTAPERERGRPRTLAMDELRAVLDRLPTPASTYIQTGNVLFSTIEEPGHARHRHRAPPRARLREVTGRHAAHRDELPPRSPPAPTPRRAPTRPGTT